MQPFHVTKLVKSLKNKSYEEWLKELTELARSKGSCCFHSILKLNHAHSISLCGWLGDSGCTSHSKQHDTCHHCKAHASPHSPRLSFIVSNCRLFPWLSSDPQRLKLLFISQHTNGPQKALSNTYTTTKTHPFWLIGLLHSSVLPNAFFNCLSFSPFQISLRKRWLISNASLLCFKAKITVFNLEIDRAKISKHNFFQWDQHWSATLSTKPSA